MYNPIPGKDGTKEIRINVERTRYWVSVGAQPSDRVAWLLGKIGVLPPAPVRVSDPLAFKVPRSVYKERKKAIADKKEEHRKYSKKLLDERKSAKKEKRKLASQKRRLVRTEKFERKKAAEAKKSTEQNSAVAL